MIVYNNCYNLITLESKKTLEGNGFFLL